MPGASRRPASLGEFRVGYEEILLRFPQLSGVEGRFIFDG